MFLENLHSMISETGMEVIQLAWRSIISPQFKVAGIFFGGEYEARGKGGQEEEDFLFHKFVRCQLEKAAVSKEKHRLTRPLSPRGRGKQNHKQIWHLNFGRI